jgi:uncharacterized protein (TIGR02118 family)
MVKLVFCLRRRSDISAEEFHRYWGQDHAALVTGYAEVLGIRRYVQLHTEPGPANAALAASRGAPEPYDGIAELWFDDAEALAASAATEEGMAAAIELAHDEERFIDHSRSPLFVAAEQVIIG